MTEMNTAAITSKLWERVLPNGDPRIERTRERLTEAVIELAAERDITTASVSELTRRAGVNRATFYNHASSPVDLLTRVLSVDLDQLRYETMEVLALDPSNLFRQEHCNLQGMIDHVLRYESIYCVGHASSVFALRVVLAEHVEKTMQDILRLKPTSLPDNVAKSLALYSAFIAHGIAGVFGAWLQLPSPREPEQVITTIEELYPTWLR